MVSMAGCGKILQRKEVNAMSTKRELEERVTELEDALEEARGLIDEALESEEDSSEEEEE